MNKKPSRATVVVSAVAFLVLGLAGPATAMQSAMVPTWLHAGSTTQYPSAGGTWQYGFWNAYVRSYYTVNRCHGSSVTYNGSTVRSIDTAAGYPSDATKFALNYWNATDAYYYRTC